MLPSQKTPPKTSLADLSILLYGPSKIGKSRMCAQAEDALFLATEAGLNHVEVFQIPISTWDQFLVACAEIAEGKHAFKTIVVDTVDNAYRMCAEHVCAKNKIQHEADLGYGKGFALVNGEFHRAVNKLSLLPYGLFLISHSQEKEFETRTGTLTRIVPSLPERARQILLGMADVILFCDFETTKGPDGKPVVRRVIRTKPTVHYEAGDRTGRLPEVIDLDYRKFVEAFNASSLGAQPAEGVNSATPNPPSPTAPGTSSSIK